jgi:hypothetical protein
MTGATAAPFAAVPPEARLRTAQPWHTAIN